MARAAEEERKRHAQQQATHEDQDLDLDDGDEAVEERPGAKPALDDAVGTAEYASHQLLQDDGDAEGGEHRIEHVAADHRCTITVWNSTQPSPYSAAAATGTAKSGGSP